MTCELNPLWWVRCFPCEDFDGEYDSYPDLEFEPDVAVFMDKIITYMHMATTIIEIEEYAEKLEAQQQIKGEVHGMSPCMH